MTGYLLLIGFVSILGQVIILRELNVSFYGIELIYLLAIGIWLLGTGLGAVLSRRTPLTSTLPLRILLLIFSVVLLMDVAVIRGLRLVFGAVPGAYLPFAYQVLGICLTVLPVSVLLGAMFGWAARFYIAEGRTLPVTYAVECAGGIAGGIAATGFMRYGVQNWTAALACAFIAVLMAVFSRHLSVGPYGRVCRFTGVILVVLLLAGISTSEKVDRYLTAWNHPLVAVSQDSPYGRITIDRLFGQVSVFENDVLSFENQGTSSQAFAHLAALSHPDPQHILLLGGGVYGMLGELIKHQPSEIVYIEINPLLIKMTKPFLADTEKALLSDSRVKVRTADPRMFLQKEAKTYDFILVAMPEPSSGQASRFFTVEFFRLCAEHLKPGGRLAFQIRSAENFWTEQLTRRAASIYLALKSASFDTLVLPGASDIFIAAKRESKDSLDRDPQVYIRRYHGRAIQASLVTPDYIRYRLTNDRVQKAGQVLAAEIVPVNSDNHPICFYYALLIWLSKFFPSLFDSGSSFFAALDKGRPLISALAVVISLLIIIAARRWVPSRRTLLAGMAGFSGMVVESVLILYYQMKRGVLYQDIGLLLTLFMVGLTFGAFVADRRFVRRSAELAGAGMKMKGKSRSRFHGAVMVSAFGLVCVITGLMTGDCFSENIFWTGTLLIAAGALVAMLFTYSGLIGRPEPREVIAPLYGADLIGGAAAALVGSLVFIPFLGLSATAFLTALLCFMSVLLI